MLSVDANILLYCYSEAAPEHAAARRFVESLTSREDVLLSEFVLTEFYLLLRNGAVLQRPLSAPDAVAAVEHYRRHPCWRIAGFPPGSRELHAQLWQWAAAPGFARRRIYDARTALCLRAFGVMEFATANMKDFQEFGFQRLWNPLEIRAD